VVSGLITTKETKKSVEKRKAIKNPFNYSTTKIEAEASPRIRAVSALLGGWGEKRGEVQKERNTLKTY